MVDKKYLNRQGVEVSRVYISSLMNSLNNSSTMLDAERSARFNVNRYFKEVSAYETGLVGLEKRAVRK